MLGARSRSRQSSAVSEGLAPNPLRDSLHGVWLESAREAAADDRRIAKRAKLKALDMPEEDSTEINTATNNYNLGGIIPSLCLLALVCFAGWYLWRWGWPVQSQTETKETVTAQPTHVEIEWQIDRDGNISFGKIDNQTSNQQDSQP